MRHDRIRESYKEHRQSLDVGLPVLAQTQIASRLILEMGQWATLGGHRVEDLDRAEKELLMVLIRVSETSTP